jgi:uncharacterized membrane protein
MNNAASPALPPAQSLNPDRVEFLIGWAALGLLAAVLAAVARGSADWGAIQPVIWVHLGAIVVSLGLAPAILWNKRGDRRHRALGYGWVTAMTIAALTSLFIREINDGGFSLIHLLSVFTVIQLPIIVLSARAHNHRRHRRAIRGMIIGALLIAGFFTFPFDRLLGHWLFA